MKRDFAVAVKAVIIKENKALVLCRSKHEMECSYMNSHQKWDLPGGGLHFFEKAEEGTAAEKSARKRTYMFPSDRRCPYLMPSSTTSTFVFLHTPAHGRGAR